MLIIVSGCSGRVSSVKKKEREKKALDTLRQSSEVESTAETLGGWGIKFLMTFCMDVCRGVVVGDLLS